MEDYEIGTQQIIHVNYDNINYELKYMGQVVQIKGNLSDGGVYIKDITVSFVTNQRYININVSDYAEDNIKYYPVFIAGDFTSTHLESKCLYIASIKTLRLICDGLATTGQGESGNTLLLIPITTEDDVIEGATNGRYMGEYAPYYTKAEITTLLSAKQDTIDSSHKLSADLVDDSTSTNKFVTAAEKTAWDNKQSALTFDSTPTENSTNPVTSGGLYVALADKQGTLTFDTTPTQNSTNPVTSGGLYDVIGDVETLINAL